MFEAHLYPCLLSYYNTPDNGLLLISSRHCTISEVVRSEIWTTIYPSYRTLVVVNMALNIEMELPTRGRRIGLMGHDGIFDLCKKVGHCTQKTGRDNEWSLGRKCGWVFSPNSQRGHQPHFQAVHIQVKINTVKLLKFKDLYSLSFCPLRAPPASLPRRICIYALQPSTASSMDCLYVC